MKPFTVHSPLSVEHSYVSRQRTFSGLDRMKSIYALRSADFIFNKIYHIKYYALCFYADYSLNLASILVAHYICL